jgi:5,6-dimethylbenzimidazole synthase
MAANGVALKKRTQKFYEVVHRRRAAEGSFTGEPIAEEVLMRILTAADAAPSVGYSKPWDFVLIRDGATRRAFSEHVQEERAAYAQTLPPDRAALFTGLTIEAITESTLSIAVTYDPLRGGPNVLGRATIDDAGLYSVCMAIENLWLAATAEDLGVTIVTFFREPVARGLLGLPDAVRPVCWLCLGPVATVADRPQLQRRGWRRNRPLREAIHHERWQPR